MIFLMRERSAEIPTRQQQPAFAFDEAAHPANATKGDTWNGGQENKTRPHQKEPRVKAHVLVAFLGYALWVTLKHQLKRRPAIVLQPSRSGVNDAQPFSPMKALALLSTLPSADIVLPTTDGREIRLRRITEPTAEQKFLLHQLGLSPPERLKSLSKCSADFATA